MSKKLKISVFLFMLLGMFVFFGGFLHAATITYKPGADTGVTGTMANQDTTVDGNKLKTCAFVREGYEFKEWSVTNGKSFPNNYGGTFDPGDTVRTDKGNLTATAQWNKLYELKINGASGLSKDVVVDSVKQGNVTLTKNFVINGGKSKITITPEEGYLVDTFTISGYSFKNWLSSTDTGYEYELTHRLNSGADITVTFKLKEYTVKLGGNTVTSLDVTNGKVLLDKNTVKHGNDCVVTLKPNTGYEVDTFTVGGNPVDLTKLVKSGDNFTYTISNVKANANVVVTYKIKTFDITLEGNEGVTLGLVGESKVNYGDSSVVTVEIAKGYTLDTATLNGANAVINEGKIELSNITTNITIKVFATKDTYVVLEGKDQKINLNKTDVLVVRFSGDADLFVGLRINGKVVPEDKYTVKSGSTIVELDPDYVDTLKNGKYTIEAVYSNGNSAKTTFTIERLSNPDTGDGIGIYMVAVIASVMGVALVVKAKRNKRANNI